MSIDPSIRIEGYIIRSRSSIGQSEAGWWLTGAQRVAVAHVARAACGGTRHRGQSIDDATADVAAFIAATPAHTTGDQVGSWVLALGEGPYVEVVGVVARTVAVDTLHRTLGLAVPAIPDPQPGMPRREPVKTKRGRAWVGMAGFEVPPNTLSGSPSEQAAANQLEAGFYMTGEQMQNPDQHRGRLHRTQIELVAASLSHANECFY